jgi:hypothetical protein
MTLTRTRTRTRIHTHISTHAQTHLYDLAYSLLRRKHYKSCLQTLHIAHALHLHSSKFTTPTHDTRFTTALDGLGLTQLLFGSAAAAHTCFLTSLREKERTLPPGQWEIVKSTVHVARALVAVGRAAEAVKWYRRGLEGYVGRFGWEAEETGWVRGELEGVVEMVAGGDGGWWVCCRV